ncbi:Transcriptional regulator, LacI family [Arthrobacter sp. PAMC 25486]|uniref:LacI family DNA-binding transcriptional regulator n=1 Tax=Arthrobacter sp. PAMC 25486 TaxID=1494608 RepID=UPI000535A428|nr:LacI family DNA-binding transcriptional regulator [Arthrobacter sp. PAMC 25486]AIY00091.1 Transcriptional regulator, LacI family [Arthrobacter sp. PAMC 25486]
MGKLHRAMIQDVAMLSGLSICTVSRALRGLPNVSATSYDKVADAAAQLGYVASSAASRLAGGSTGSIAIIAPTTTAWFFAHAVETAEEVFAASGHDTMIISLRNDPAVHQRLFGDLAALAQKVDGVLLLNIELSDAEIEALDVSALAVASVGMHNVPWDNVGIDNVAAARLATEHLLGLGHWDLAILSNREKGNRSVLTATERRHGFELALAERDIMVDPDLVIDAGSSIEGGQRAMNELIENRGLPSAVFAGCDETAFGALTALHDHGLSAPRNISIIGLDEHPMSKFMGLSTVQQPVADQGALGANLLVERLQTPASGLEPANHLLATTLLTRTSTRRKR